MSHSLEFSLKLIVKLFHLPMVFSRKGFYVNLVFFFIFVLLYCAIDNSNCYVCFKMISKDPMLRL